MGVTVNKPGICTTIQDLGRRGYLGSGFSPSGVMDKRAARIANLLVDNDENAPVLDRKLSRLVEDQRFGDDMVELDDLAGDIEAATFAADAATLIHGSLEHGDLLAAGELATPSHQAASKRP